jgi:ferritin-like metal-binding protein YciE
MPFDDRNTWPASPRRLMMADDNLKELVSQGLSAMKAGSDVAARATDEISNDVTHPDLKAALEQGNRTSQQWADRIERAMEQTGPGQQGDNKILEAHYEVSRLIRQQAPDASSRDLGIVAAGQLALHYWIAAFGTMASYLGAIGLSDAAGEMKASADEAKQADQQHTELAEKLLSA